MGINVSTRKETKGVKNYDSITETKYRALTILLLLSSYYRAITFLFFVR